MSDIQGFAKYLCLFINNLICSNIVMEKIGEHLAYIWKKKKQN